MNHIVDLPVKLLAQSRDAAETALQIADGIYTGVDLTVKFADEIAAAPYSGDAWAWIKGRIQAGNYAGIHVFDWIPFTADAHDYQAQIAGINTHTEYGDTPTGNHIDFITKELWHAKRAMNVVDYNNGAALPDGSREECDWLLADLKHYLNSESGYIVTDEVDRVVETVDYTDSGVYKYLPTALKSVIIEKRTHLLGRYVSFVDATEPQFIHWKNLGKLWLPSDYEMIGMDSIASTNTIRLRSYVARYPLFSGNARTRLKKFGTEASAWWTMSPTRNVTSYMGIDADAAPVFLLASESSAGFPICFRVG